MSLLDRVIKELTKTEEKAIEFHKKREECGEEFRKKFKDTFKYETNHQMTALDTLKMLQVIKNVASED